MVLMNLGSVATVILSEVEGVPSSISGAPLMRMADGVRLYMESYTGQTIGSTAIAEIYQPALIDLTKSKVYMTISDQGTDASSVTLGDFTINKGSTNTATKSSSMFELSGMQSLKSLGKTCRYNRVIGGA